MHYCLSIDQLKEFISHKLLDEQIDDASLITLLDRAKNWEVSLGFLVYFFSCILEKRVNSDHNIENLIDDFYKLDHIMNARIQGFDHEFIAHLIRNIREKELTLEDELIRLQTNLAEYNYDKIIRV